VPRATFYGRRPANLASDEDLLYMRLIDEEYTRHPFYGSRRMVVFLQRGGHEVNRKHCPSCDETIKIGFPNHPLKFLDIHCFASLCGR
jgi:hypothetical protein